MTKDMLTRRNFITVAAGASAFALAACGGSKADEGAAADAGADAADAVVAGDGTDAKGEGVMTYAEFMDAAVDDEVVVECFVQDTQSWWEDQITIYAADADGGYFIYNAACSEEDAAKLTLGQKIKVSGYKAEWSGEIEIAEGTIEFEDGNYISEAIDVTDLLGTDELIEHQNQRVSFTGLTVEPSTDPDGKEVAYLFNYDGSGSAGDDLYFNASKDGEIYSFTVESYLTGEDTDVYKAVQALEIGQVINMTGYLYWYEGANPHIISVEVAK